MSQEMGKDHRGFLLSELKEALRRQGSPAVGNKAELIQRLDEHFPDRSWESCITPRPKKGGNPVPEENDITVEENDALPEASTLRLDAPVWRDSSAENAPDRLLRMEMELMRRERELMQRELQLLQRENDMLRQSPGSSRETERKSGASIKAIGELLADFSGAEQCFHSWRKQLALLISTYDLDDNLSRILIGSKLKGKALSWFQSRTEHLEVSTDELLVRMESMLHHRESRLEARRKFESRRWAVNENFGEYFHDKLILANRVPVAEEEMVDTVIDGIPDVNLRNQARMCNITTISALLGAFSKIKLSPVPRCQVMPGMSTSRP
ncbi:uncharacterized protein LOC128888608 [Hylaeus anthracinus]|uniref:uncharacterized protein LOC128888608 n=1 Tax=Hylaeus anthracinus TaxID=313031 RepID=UPI0023B8DBE3|nr:uncharacterized protein LOC128888608 [Hylaeus anthracinus]